MSTDNFLTGISRRNWKSQLSVNIQHISGKCVQAPAINLLVFSMQSLHAQLRFIFLVVHFLSLQTVASSTPSFSDAFTTDCAASLVILQRNVAACDMRNKFSNLGV
jgi:hypothetical protein